MLEDASLDLPDAALAPLDLVVGGSDTHAIDGFDDLRYGRGQLRRGRLARRVVANTRAPAALERIVQPHKSRMVARP